LGNSKNSMGITQRLSRAVGTSCVKEGRGRDQSKEQKINSRANIEDFHKRRQDSPIPGGKVKEEQEILAAPRKLIVLEEWEDQNQS